MRHMTSRWYLIYMKFLSLSIHHLSLLYPNYLLTSLSSSYSYNYPLRLKRSLIFLNHSPRGSNHTFEREEREEKKRTKWTKFGRVTSGCRCVSIGSHVTQVASDFPNKLPPRESRVSETFIDTLLCIHGHTPGIMGLPGPPTPFPPLCSAGCGPHFMLVTPLFPESVYYHRPVSSFMQNNLISRASKSR